jgi:hypothetical protein
MAEDNCSRPADSTGTHPTAIVLTDLKDWVFSDAHRQVLAIEVVKYGWDILNKFHNINWID